MQRWLCILTGTLFFSLSPYSQNFLVPKNYFRNPVSIPMQLSANFGELRPNHWHMGLDIRTDAKENYPVYASAAGYIAKIGIRPQSFGRFIIINHPNGLSTLYAHLNDFFPELEEYVSAKQYEKESWAIELDFTEKQFPVSKGAFIAYSGNSGGSQGPHLHFEIYETKSQKRLNPLLFDFSLHDDVPPHLMRLAIYDRSKSIYESPPFFYTLKKTDSGYIIPKTPVVKTALSRVSFAIQAYDRLSGSNNPNGIYAAKLYVDGEPQLKFVLDSIDYNETLFINAHVDYKLRYNGGAYVQHLSQLPGNYGSMYRKIKSDGVIELKDTTPRFIEMVVEDAAGNFSKLNFIIQRNDSLSAPYGQTNSNTRFAPGVANVLSKPGFEFYLSDKSLYDTVSPVYYVMAASSPYAYSDQHQVGDPSIPLHEEALIRIKLKKPVPAEWQDKLLIQRTDNKGSNYRKAVWQEQWLSARFARFGTFQVVADVLPPSINDLGKGDTINLSSAKQIVFTPTDNFGIKSFRAELNGKWLRFTNDKSRNWIYRFDEKCPYGVHHLKAIVEDLAGNITQKEWWFKRYPYTAPAPKKKPAAKAVDKSKKPPSNKNQARKKR